MNDQQAFLKELAGVLAEDYKGRMDRCCIILPNRRSGVVLLHHLAALVDPPAWTPSIKPLNIFFSELSGLEPADPVELNFELYRVYASMVANPDPFDEFYYWAEMMISDFNEIDKYLVNAGDIFTNLRDLKEIERNFPYLDEEQIKTIRFFWEHFPGGKELTNHQKSFLGMWELLPRIYTEFRKRLLAKSRAYEGMMYRQVAERIREMDYPELDFDHYLIAGFNALSKAEEALFSHLNKIGKARFYWDYDDSFLENPLQESGRFLRSNLQKFPQADERRFPRDGFSRPKNLKIYSLPSDILQTTRLSEILEENLPGNEEDFMDTAVILSDESLIQPVLSALPASLKAVNITMGYPLKLTPVYSFAEALIRLQKNLGQAAARRKDKFYFRDVLRILNHQFIRQMNDEKINRLIRSINMENRIYLKKDFFESHPVCDALFRVVNRGADMTAYLEQVFSLCLPGMDEDTGSSGLREFYFFLRQKLFLLREVFEHYPEETGIQGFYRIFRKVIGGLSVPFESEPVRGVQIMGILESRLLDFRRIIVLSLNEGTMPAQGAEQSYIPLSLKKAFGLPVKKDRDSIYAYYFFRLLMRSQEVHLLCNTSSEGMKSGEPSRYIHQLRYLYGFNPAEETVSFNIHPPGEKTISIRKTPAVMALLDGYSETGERKLSPSSLACLLECGLKFCLSYLLRIKEEEEVEEEAGAILFGDILHKTLELIYQPLEGRKVDAADIDGLARKEHIKEMSLRAFRKVMTGNEQEEDFEPEGRNLIVMGIIEYAVKKFLEFDRGRAPFIMKGHEIAMEELVEIPGLAKKIRMGGTIDRMDEQGGLTSIIDYKTGTVNIVCKNVADLFIRDKPEFHKMKGIFQLLLYSWLLRKKDPGREYREGIYKMREVFDEKFSPWIFEEGSADHYSDFETGIHGLITGLFDEHVAFEQTTERKRCVYCAFKELCRRSAETSY